MIEVRHLTKIFGRRRKAALKMVRQQKSKTEILKKTGCTVGVYDANFTVQDGEIFVIMGLSGSGKSTLIRLINRLIHPDEGEILIDGRDVAAMDAGELRTVRREKINMVFQKFGLFPNRTILENTEFGLELRGVDKAARRTAARKALDDANLLPFANQYPHQLSGGMQQRVGLARALANDPDILLMDEAFSALDPLIRRRMQDELLDLQQEMHKTILFITHDLNEALRIGDRIALMKDGQILQIGTGEEILMNPANDYVRDFVENVDKSKVLTAANIMIPAFTANLDLDGPTVALNKMKQEKTSMLLAIDRHRHFCGILTAEAALLAKKTRTPLADHVQTDIETVTTDTVVSDIVNVLSSSPYPLPVVQQGRLKGVIIRSCIIDALADGEDEPRQAAV